MYSYLVTDRVLLSNRLPGILKEGAEYVVDVEEEQEAVGSKEEEPAPKEEEGLWGESLYEHEFLSMVSQWERSVENVKNVLANGTRTLLRISTSLRKQEEQFLLQIQLFSVFRGRGGVEGGVWRGVVEIAAGIARGGVISHYTKS